MDGWMGGWVYAWKEWMERMDGCYMHGPTENKEESQRRKWGMDSGRTRNFQKVSLTFELKLLAVGSQEEAQLTKEGVQCG